MGTTELKLSKAASERFLALQRKMEAPDPGVVILNALRLFEAAVNESEAGSTFLIKRKSDVDPVPWEIFKSE